jgi:DNA-3-methyladenine glycosylase
MKLSRKFYSRDTRTVARELLNKILVHKTKKGILKGRIVETEAYLGHNDPGAIGSRNVKKIPQSLLKSAGHAFVYFTYGAHWMFNVTAKEGLLGAVLIRALEPLEGIELMKKIRNTDELNNLTNGPGKLTQAFCINKEHDGKDLTKEDLFISHSNIPKNFNEKFEIVRTTRIGLSKGQGKLLRYYIKDNPFVSVK